jgi:glycosyltransferase involved in cell wall biosynthesis
VAQTETQRHLFLEHFGVETEVIPNPVELPSVPADPGANQLVLWLSTYKPFKRPEWFTTLARRLPQFNFLMIGLPSSGEDAASWQAAQGAAIEQSNLEVHGFIEHARIGEFLRRTALFVHTSPVEGFPMTLLEAWSYGIPTVTTTDPGGTVKRHAIGEVAASLDDLEQTVARIMRAPDWRRELGARARNYVQQHHGPDRTYEPLAARLDELIARKHAS